MNVRNSSVAPTLKLCTMAAIWMLAFGLAATRSWTLASAQGNDDDMLNVSEAVLADPEIRQGITSLSEEQRLQFHEVVKFLPSVMWAPSNQLPVIRKREDSIELFLLVRDHFSPEVEATLSAEIERASTFIERSGGPSTSRSLSLTESNYWIVFDKIGDIGNPKIASLISEKFFGGDTQLTSRWLSTIESQACIDYVAVDSSSAIRQGVTLINMESSLKEQSDCIWRSYFTQVGIYVDPAFGAERLLASTNGKIVGLLYKSGVTSGSPPVVAYPILLKEALKQIKN